MSSIINTISNFIYAINQFILNLVMGAWQLISMIPSALTMLTYSIGYMPTILTAFAIALITISIVFLVVGR